MIVHPWHGIDPGEGTPETVDCIIEIPRGSHQKYEMDKKTGLLRLDRVLYSAVFYPANYGFIPRTYCDDRDPLDILVLGQEPVVPMCILTARPIGVMQMWDQDEEDDKIIAVHEHDPAFRHYRDISELPQHTLFELQQFFEDYKKLEHKKVRIERRKGRDDAHIIINTSLRLYSDSFDAQGDKRTDAPVLASEMTQSKDAPLPSRRTLAESARRAAARLQASDEESALFKTTYLNSTPDIDEPIINGHNAPTETPAGAQAIADAAHSTDVTGAPSPTDANESDTISTSANIKSNGAPANIVMDEGTLEEHLSPDTPHLSDPSPCKTSDN